MAVSPAHPVTGAPPPSSSSSAANKPLAVRPNHHLSSHLADAAPSSSVSPANGAPGVNVMELPEQLNEEVKHKYIKDKKLGEGTYATVHLGHLSSNPSHLVAIKKIKIIPTYHDGLTMDSIREIKHLQELSSHPHIITLHSVFSSARSQNLNLVLEYLPAGDLEQLIKSHDTIRYGAADVKAWMGMLASAVAYCHAHFVLHRDIKPNNLLIAGDGAVKLADFGLARSFADPYPNMTHQVITRWYRPPELLYGARHYGGGVDVWSMGVVFAELVLRTPFLPGNTDVHQLELICQAVGVPDEENWPGVSKLPDYVPPEKNKAGMVAGKKGKEHFTSLFGTSGAVGVELLMGMLSLDPRKRPSAREVVGHRWWTIEPRPTRKEDLPKRIGAGGVEARVGRDLGRKGGVVDEDEREKGKDRGGGVARRLDFGAARK